MANFKLADSDFKQINEVNNQTISSKPLSIISPKSLIDKILYFKLDFFNMSLNDFIEENKDKLTKSKTILIIIYLALYKDITKSIKRNLKTTSKYYWDMILKNSLFKSILQKRISISNLIKICKKILMLKNINKLFFYILNENYLGEVIDNDCNGLNVFDILIFIYNINNMLIRQQINYNNNEPQFISNLRHKFKEEIDKVKQRKNEVFKKNEKNQLKNQSITNTQQGSMLSSIYNKYNNIMIPNNRINDKLKYTKIVTNPIPKKPLFDDINKIVYIFSDHFKDVSKDKIIEILGQCSFNLIKAYETLNYIVTNQRNYINNINNNNEDNNVNLKEKNCFSSVDDYILKYMQNCEIYERLVEDKGLDNINARKKYLKIN